MICAKCREAGTRNAEANRAVWFDGIAAAEEIRGKARALHAQCLSPGCDGYHGCDCHHVIGDVIDRTAARNMAAQGRKQADK